MRLVLMGILTFMFLGLNAQYTPDDENNSSGRNNSTTTTSSDSDDGEMKTLRDRLYVGGDLGLQFGTYNLINISTFAGYSLTEDFSVGVGARYMWFKDNIFNESTSIYGGSTFMRYLIGDYIIAHAEYELLNVERYDPFSGALGRENIFLGLIGGGYRQNFGGGSYLQMLILYDVINDPLSPFTISQELPLVFRGGIVINL